MSGVFITPRMNRGANEWLAAIKNYKLTDCSPFSKTKMVPPIDELDDFMDIDLLGGFITKSITQLPTMPCNSSL